MSRIVGGDVLDAPWEEISDGAHVELLPYGKIADQYINQISTFYNDIEVDSYVIMPNHIHIILVLLENEALEISQCGASRTSPPTTRQHSRVSRFVSTFKRFCNKNYGANIWQSYFNDHIIRNREDYENHLKYIYENPSHWFYDELHTEN